MRQPGEHILGSPTSDHVDDERQSPQWSLAPFGWQQRQPAGPPAPPARRGEQQRKEAAKAKLQGHGREETEWADEAPRWHTPRTSPWRHSPRLSPGKGLCSGVARWACNRRRGRLWAAALSCTVLALIGWASWRQASGQPVAAGRWAAAGAGSGQQQQRCRLQLDGSAWEQHCQRLRRVCVDQGQLVLYDDRYQQLDGRRAGSLPELLVDTSKIFEYPWRKTSSSGSGGASSGRDKGAAAATAKAEQRRALKYVVEEPGKNRRIPPLPMRPATSEEPTPYLQGPAFSTCTVPILLYPSWRANFFHVFKDLSAVVYALLRRTPWRLHAKLVVVTPDGLRLTQPESQLLPPLSGLSVQSFADFSRRLPASHQPGQVLEPALPRPASYEGGEQRCFDTVFFCGRNFPVASGLPPEEEAAASSEVVAERLAKEIPVEPYSYAQALAGYMAAQRKEQERGRPRGGLPDAISLQQAAAASGGQQPHSASARSKLRVLLMKRGSEGRQILNAAELLERCNAWLYRPPGGGPAVTAECREVSLPDLEAGVAAAREADVFIGMHGANLANGWMMRPGSSVIEFIPYQFDVGRGSFVFSVTNSLDATSQVLWWVAVMCDPAASTPGPEELAGTGLPDWYPRDRNTRVPWAAVEAALAEVVAAGGDRQRYMQQYYSQGLHQFSMDERGVMARGSRYCPNSTLPSR